MSGSTPACAANAGHDEAEPCPLCEAIAGRGRDPVDQPWLLADDVAVLPAWGHVTVGHVMVCSRHHVPSLAAAGPSLAAEALLVLDEVNRRARTTLQLEPFVFEHGYRKGVRTSSTGERDCSINHLHIHVLPVPPVVLQALESELAGFEAVTGAPLDAVAGTDDYLLAGFGDPIAWFRSPAGFAIRSRHFLKIAADLLGYPEGWDETIVDPRQLIRESKARLFPDARALVVG